MLQPHLLAISRQGEIKGIHSKLIHDSTPTAIFISPDDADTCEFRPTGRDRHHVFLPASERQQIVVGKDL